MSADILILVLAALMLSWGLLYAFMAVRARVAAVPVLGLRRVLQSLALPLLGMGLSIGLLLSTAGVAVYPGLLGIAAPLACDGQFQVQSQAYFLAPGVEGSENSAWCVREADGTRERITIAATFWCTLVYGSVFAGLLSVALSLGRRRQRALRSSPRGTDVRLRAQRGGW